MKDQARFFLEHYASFTKGEIETKEFKRGEYITSFGQIERNIYLIKEGAVRAYYISDEEEDCFVVPVE